MNQSLRVVMVAALASCASWAGAQTLVTERSLSLNAAIELATASLEQCRAQGFKVSITVLNRHARTVVSFSDDGASPHTLENSMRKAYTAFTTRAPSADAGKRPPAYIPGFLQLDKTTIIEGGLPVFAGKEIVGSIGISGSPGGEKDAACAQAGIDKIAKGLNG